MDNTGLYWVKLHTNIHSDARLMRLPGLIRLLFLDLLVLAGKVNQDGKLPDLDEIAWTLRIDEAELREGMTKLEENGLVELDNNGCWYLVDFIYIVPTIQDLDES